MDMQKHTDLPITINEAINILAYNDLSNPNYGKKKQSSEKSLLDMIYSVSKTNENLAVGSTRRSMRRCTCRR